MKKAETEEERMLSANRLRNIRENAGLTQEQFAEKIGISTSGYKKIEHGVNGVTSEFLRLLHENVGISADYVLFGKTQSVDNAWEEISNCSEEDKLFILMRLTAYLTIAKKGTFPFIEKQTELDKEIRLLIKKFLNGGKD
ncbi:MAG: helix-turn-helix transcriptional regulator [Lachnospiraceae bacterium]|nr:helix-turn-helix transcriptional regulator [Lachnospiraceae bacterium]